ncbi:hypothetical protein DPMN_037404 [Dreissena polymorpha]|uniref:Uncharacterized protein n=1 Tax=Dreissena polymorpha TaxID=45954 RepID=A0A9D4MAX0_DREPO|nr:hypothetical protein DPMN_037404 [Dreissena polymorpha]
MSYGYLIDRDVRHLYKGDPHQLRLLWKLYRESADPMDRVREQFDRTRSAHMPTKCYQYLRGYDIVVQRAAGFQQLSRSDINHCVDRLHSSKRPAVIRHDCVSALSGQLSPESATQSTRLSKSAPAGGRGRSAAPSSRLASAKAPSDRSSHSPAALNGHVQAIVDRVYTEALTNTSRRRVRSKVVVPRHGSATNRNKHLDNAMQMMMMANKG